MKPILEKLTNSKSSSFKLLHFSDHQDAAPFHYHPEYEITLQIGGGRRFIGNNMSDFYTLDLVVLGKNVPHCWTDLRRSEFLVVQFADDSFGQGFFDLPEMHTVKQFLGKAEKGISFSKKTTEELKIALFELKAKKGVSRLLHLFALLEKMAQSTDLTEISQVVYNMTAEQSRFERIQKVFDYVYTNFQENINVNQAAQVANMKTTAFCNYFKRHTNKRFSDFVNEIRIGHASRLLIETDMQVAEIAYASGYSSLSNFNKQFKVVNRVSPKTYRGGRQL